MTRARYLWLVGPSDRRAYAVSYAPLRLEALEELPPASRLGLDDGPPEMMTPPTLLT